MGTKKDAELSVITVLNKRETQSINTVCPFKSLIWLMSRASDGDLIRWILRNGVIVATPQLIWGEIKQNKYFICPVGSLEE